MIWRTLILTFRLMIDRRVSLGAKLIPIIGLIYYFSPIDLVPDVFAAFGMLDDIGIFMGLIGFFIRRAPDEVLREHLDNLSKHDKVLQMVRNLAPVKPQDDVIDGQYRRP